MKNNFLLLTLSILLLIPFGINAQSNGYKIITEDRKVSSFDGIDINGRFKVVLFQSSSPKVSVTAAEEFISTIETNVKNNTLVIKMMDPSNNKGLVDNLKAKYNDYLSEEIIEIRIGISNLNKLKVSGISSYESEFVINSSNLHIDASNASKGDIKVNVSDKLTVSLTGAAKLELDGSAKNVQVSAIGASSLAGDDFSTKNATVKQSGASRVEIVATESIDADLSGATKLVCKGSPKSVKQNASRGSSITIK